jgi:long-subunit acyl-CoA synthetase (AMP-forming)
MVGQGIEPKQRVGVFGANSPSWMIAMQVTETHLHSIYDVLNQKWTSL